jgi:hypothetical protein
VQIFKLTYKDISGKQYTEHYEKNDEFSYDIVVDRTTIKEYKEKETKMKSMKYSDFAQQPFESELMIFDDIVSKRQELVDMITMKINES